MRGLQFEHPYAIEFRDPIELYVNRGYSILVLFVFVNPDSEACELIGDLEASVVFIRHSVVEQPAPCAKTTQKTA
jgi:hypothetical protein